MGTNLDDISKDDMKDTSEIEACNVGNQGTELAVFIKMHYITSFSFNNTTSKMRSNLW